MIKVILLMLGIILTFVTIILIATKQSAAASIVSAIFALVAYFISLNPSILNQEKIEPAISLNINSLELFNGDGYILNATISPDNAIIEWISSNSEIITVNNDGVLKAINEGTATITAKIIYKKMEYTDSCNVIIKKPTINLDNSHLLYIGEVKDLSVITSPDKNGVTWSSNDPSIVTVNNNGKIEG